MTELDFDELDKAVSSIMSNVDTTKRNAALDDPEMKVVELTPTEASVAATDALSNLEESPTTTMPTEAAIPAVVESESMAKSAPAPASLAMKRRGQFMDMIHPSSDMKSAPRPVRREGVVIAPAATLKPTDSKPAILLESLDLEDASTAVERPSITPEPQSSPFLPGTKPEKRPLGSGVSISEETPVVEDTQDVETDLQASPVADAVVLPEELNSELLAVESNDLTGKTAETEPLPPVEVPTTESVDTKQKSVQPPAGGSIAQQYTEAPSTGDQTSGSIYDTANYHQAIEATTPSKKGSPLKWIVLSIVLLVVGGGAGIAYFLLTH